MKIPSLPRQACLTLSLLVAAGTTLVQAQDTATWSSGAGKWSDLVWATTEGTDVAYANKTTTHAIFEGTTGGVVDMEGQTYKARVLIFNTDGYTITNGTLTRDNTYDTAFGAAAGVTATISNVTVLRDGILIGGGNAPNSGTIVLAGSNGLTASQYVKSNGTSSGTLVFDSATASGDGQVALTGVTFRFGATTTSTMGSLEGNSAFSLSNASSQAVALTIGTATNSKSTTYSGIISGAGSITKTGTGNLELSGANTYTGGTTINGGRINASKASGFGTSDVIVNDGGQAWVSAAGTYANNFTVTGKGITEASGNIGAVRVSGGANISGNITITGDTRIGAHNNASANTISGNIVEGGGSHALEFGGTDNGGKIILAGTASHTGGTTINLGTLQLGASERFNATGTIDINGGTLDLGTYTQTASAINLTSGTLSNGTIQTTTLTTDIAGTASINNLTFQGGLTKTGDGTLTLSGTNTYGGNITVTQGTLLVSNAGAIATDSGRISVADGATLGFTIDGDAWTATQISTIVQDGSTFSSNAILGINLTTGTSNFDASFLTGNQGLTKIGEGTLALGSSTSDATANTYTGLTTVSAGTLNLNKAAGTTAIAGDLLITGTGILSINGNANQIADTANLTFEGGGKLGANGQKIVDTVNNVTVKGRGGNFNPGSGSDLKVNSLTFLDSTGSAANQYSIAANGANSTVTIGAGGWAMTNSTYSIGQNGSYTATVKLNGDFTGSGTNRIFAGANNSNLTLDAKSTIDLQNGTRTFNIIDGTTTVGPKITNGSLTKSGSGVLVLVGANTYTGITTVAGGTLLIDGNQSSSTGNVIVMNGGTMGGSGTVGGSVTIQSGGTLAPGDSPGMLNVAGDVTLEAGAFLVLEINGTESGQYDLLNFTTSGSKLNFENGSRLNIALSNGVDLSSGLIIATGTNLEIMGLDTLSITSSTGQQLQLGADGMLTAIPEPSTYAMGAAILLGTLAFVHRRRRK